MSPNYCNAVLSSSVVLILRYRKIIDVLSEIQFVDGSTKVTKYRSPFLGDIISVTFFAKYALGYLATRVKLWIRYSNSTFLRGFFVSYLRYSAALSKIHVLLLYFQHLWSGSSRIFPTVLPKDSSDHLAQGEAAVSGSKHARMSNDERPLQKSLGIVSVEALHTLPLYVEIVDRCDYLFDWSS